MEKIDKHENDFNTYKHLLESDDIAIEVANFNKLNDRINFARKIVKTEMQKGTFEQSSLSFTDIKEHLINLNESDFQEIQNKYKINNGVLIKDLLKEPTKTIKKTSISKI